MILSTVKVYYQNVYYTSNKKTLQIVGFFLINFEYSTRKYIVDQLVNSMLNSLRMGLRMQMSYNYL